MKKLLTLCLVALFSISVYSQSVDAQIDALINEGIAFHDDGEYDKAIAKYDEALKLDKFHLMALIEKALTCYYQKNYKDAIDLCRLAIKKHNGNAQLQTGYLTLGNALDVTGKQKDAIKAYDEGIRLAPDFYQLYYNKAVTLYGMKRYEDALENYVLAVQKNPKHAGSNNGVGQLNRVMNNKVQAYMAFARFLALEPASNRSADILRQMQSIFSAGIQQGENNTTITLSASMFDGAVKGNPNSFSSVELMMILSESISRDSIFKNQNEVEKLNTQFTRLASALKEQRANNSGFYWNYYAPYFIEMLDKGLIEVFAYIALASTRDQVIIDWLELNEAKLEEFFTWSDSFVFTTE